MIEFVRARLPRRIGPSAGVAAGLVVGVVLAAIAIPRRQPVAVQAGGTTSPSAVASGAQPQSGASGGATVPTVAGATPVGGSGAGAAPSGGGSVAASGSPSAGGGTTGAAAPVAAAQGGGRGITPSTVKIGVAYLDLSAVRALGPEFDNGNVPQQWDAILDDWHRRHVLPVAGRDVQFAYRSYDVTSNDAQRSACVGLVGDEKVFAVIGIEFFYQAGADCVARQFRTPLITSEGPGDDVYTRAAPLLFSLQPSEDRLLHNFVQWAERTGLFNGAKIGLYYSTDPVETQIVNRSVKAELAKLHHSIAAEVQTDNKTASPQDAIAVQKFRSAGVNLAIILDAGIGFLEQAEVQSYHPKYIQSDFNGGTSDTGTATYPSDAYQGTLAMTTVRRGEPAAGIPLSPQEEACVTNYERYSGKKISRPGPKGHELAQWVFVVLACDESNVLLHALQNAGRNLTQATFVAGLQGIHNLPLIRYPNVTWGPGKFQGVDSQRTLQWTSDCTCWRAQGQFAPLFL